MNKSELIDAISGSSGVGKGDIDSVLKALEEVVTSAVCGGGDKISLSGFLTFELLEQDGIRKQARHYKLPEQTP